MILPHTFDEASHIYKVENHFVMATSDVVDLNGLGLPPGIPAANREFAGWRGTQTHRAIQFFEEEAGASVMAAAKAQFNELNGPLGVIQPYFMGYLKFRKDYEFEPIGDLEKQLVYLFGDPNMAIGATIDIRGRIHGHGFQGKPMIGDVKTATIAHADGNSKDLRQKKLAYRLQTQSYLEATAFDEEWWKLLPQEVVYSNEYPIKSPSIAGRFIVNPTKGGSYNFFDFSDIDDSRLWHSACLMAKEKLAAGIAANRG